MKARFILLLTVLLIPMVLTAQRFNEKIIREKLEKDFTVKDSFLIFSTINNSIRTFRYQTMKPPQQLSDLKLECYKSTPPTAVDQERYEDLLRLILYEQAYKGLSFDLSDTIASIRLYGDYNGDGIKEYCWFEEWYQYDTTSDIDSEKNNRGAFLFSDKSILPLVIDWCPWAAFQNEGDLNDDGMDEIGVLCSCPSNCQGYSVYTYKDKKWIDAVDRCCGTAAAMRASGLDLVKKDPDRKGYVIIMRSADAFEDDNKRLGMPEGFASNCCCAWCNVVETSVKIK
jgi:hypothetical protein